MTAQLGRVILGDGRMLRDVQGGSQARPAGLDLGAGGGQGGRCQLPHVAALWAGGQDAPSGLTTSDAGALLHALDLFNNIRGGQLTIVGRTDPSKPDSPLAGRVEMTDYEAVNAPALARLLNAASPAGFAELVEGRSISFAKLTGEFRWEEAAEEDLVQERPHIRLGAWPDDGRLA